MSPKGGSGSVTAPAARGQQQWRETGIRKQSVIDAGTRPDTYKPGTGWSAGACLDLHGIIEIEIPGIVRTVHRSPWA